MSLRRDTERRKPRRRPGMALLDLVLGDDLRPWVRGTLAFGPIAVVVLLAVVSLTSPR